MKMKNILVQGMIAFALIFFTACSQQSGTTRVLIDVGDVPAINKGTGVGTTSADVATFQLWVIDNEAVINAEQMDEEMSFEEFIRQYTIIYRSFGVNESIEVEVSTGKTVNFMLMALDADGNMMYIGIAENILITGSQVTVPIVMENLSSGGGMMPTLFVNDGASGTGYASDDPLGSIQSAIDSATYGDVIAVAGGTYSESITLKDGVVLMGGFSEDFSTQDDVFITFGAGANMSVINGVSGTGNTLADPTRAVYIPAGVGSGALFEGFKVIGTGSNSVNTALFCQNATPVISHNTINAPGTGSTYGIVIKDSDGIIVTGNKITNGASATNYGIYSDNSSSFIEANIVDIGDSQTTYGIYSTGPFYTPSIINNVITGTGAANAYGIFNNNIPNLSIMHNTINIGGGVAYGVYGDTDSTGMIIINNIITGAGYGIYVKTNNEIPSMVYNNDIFDVDNAPFRNNNGGGNLTLSQINSESWGDSNIDDTLTINVDGSLSSPPVSVIDGGFAYGVSTDINENPRDPSTPTIGAYEY